MHTLALKINDDAYDKVMYLLNNLSKDVEIVGSFEIESLDENDEDYKLLLETRDEKSYKIDDVIKEFE